jgi:hypothetical protein
MTRKQKKKVDFFPYASLVLAINYHLMYRRTYCFFFLFEEMNSVNTSIPCEQISEIRTDLLFYIGFNVFINAVRRISIYVALREFCFLLRFSTYALKFAFYVVMVSRTKCQKIVVQKRGKNIAIELDKSVFRSFLAPSVVLQKNWTILHGDCVFFNVRDN